MSELASRFQFNDIENKWCERWEKENLFHAQPNSKKKPYTIVIPPPNITGILHMGHALNNTLQDILIRYKRMQGFETCWMPGTDHAGIATQNVVERQLAQEGLSRHDIGREEMIKRLWAWKTQYGDTIINQLKKIGSSCDWQRTRFTMDDDYSDAVKETFVRLYDKGLIYRGRYIINWCPRCHTALSDEEAEHRDQQGALYFIRYPLLESPDKGIMVATTRPETMLGDTAVAVNPRDERYKDLLGKTLILPIVNRQIKIIADDFVDPKFGTGAVKVTPAHDPNDFAMGNRHHLEFINVLHPDGRMNDAAGEFSGMDRFEAREAILETLKNLKLLAKVEPHNHAVGHCYRCHTVVEPYLSKQWFVKMKPLAEPAIKAVAEGRIRLNPEHWTKVYLNWMENIRDWCISRQIWWGHRIPVWYCPICPDGKNLVVTKSIPNQCPRCGSHELKQDEDVLDTWFSSWLWPFATFGWPYTAQEFEGDIDTLNNDLSFFYPTNALFTASEIIFFWVARMIMAGFEFMGDIPFRDVYIHGTVRDSQGRKMSKSLGNAIDPLEIIREYGADALRFSLIINSGQDLYISKEKFEIGRNFANKIWNASRLVLLNLKSPAQSIDPDTDINIKNLNLPDRWILSRFYTMLKEISTAIDNYRFSEAENLIYEFFWRTYCDWYLEISKNELANPNKGQIAFFILEQSIRVIQPFMPFVTAELWEHFNLTNTPCCLAPWPKSIERFIDKKAEGDMDFLIGIITNIRNTRSQWNVKPQQEIECFFAVDNESGQNLLNDNRDLLRRFLKLSNLEISTELRETQGCAAGVILTVKYAIPLKGIVDIGEEKKRMQKDLEQTQKLITGLHQRLGNPSFRDKAPKDVIEKEEIRLKELTVKSQEINQVLSSLCG